MELIILKVLILLSILISGFPGLIPYALDKYVKIKHSKKEYVIGLGNCFVAGIFLSIAFVHLLNESSEKLSEVNHHIPLAFIMCPVGFVVVFMIEKIFNCFEGHNHGHSHGGSKKNKKNKNKKNKKNNNNLLEESTTIYKQQSGSSGYIILESSNLDEQKQPKSVSPKFPHSPSYGTFQDITIDTSRPPSPFPQSPNLSSSSSSSIPTTTITITQDIETPTGDEHLPMIKEDIIITLENDKSTDSSTTSLKGPTPIILVFILSIHSIISGFTLGVESNYDIIYPLFIGIISHKWLEAMSLGVSLVRNKSSFYETLKLVSLYSLTEPLGIVLGVAASVSVASTTATSLVLAFSSGTFIYIALMDILVVEFNESIKQSRLTKLVKLAFCIIGFLGMSALTLAFHSEDEEVEGH
ncbi:hypothetical protein DFA_04547 [Cavenderia fasciculata]|uniref:Zinc/iron permease n=1 Tax=Cavenderia fasciculata TaxID=261658 RepID=F4PPW2_CACFS|nr:uncharacterized protein DFA_04547 [Cavenderia fasciculata]EGG22425.1 hypothetical protein DFA_04547 [Cavenderia fasciculata]|eukprot:XP_004360276.1 hypothetical protein DFA_04547 [Cavenderia fasciculata]